ncbi:NAD(P)H-dependent oxidoreductase [Ichthyenterobacterium sp. W332]|uniref:NAD(P)H-dependent oxidoreductase n=1 Tax=Microcosmobacter mediterraneus TaxID=3075607 RepID=A0ABU2YK86_9FLAO|nr:NAD(P)H-dependent oxidoreductase [Ichthyenterobacterium sp. W332]MDT0557635.1 NAD(P)H-dependent oxidoreductase [Ichthyenterobacterium sp. W332]
MSVIESLEWRYATKKFNPNAIVSDEKLEIVKQAFNLTATSFGLQTIKLVVVTEKEIRTKLVPFSFGQEQVSDASHLLVICIDNNITSDDVDNHFDHVKTIRSTPEDILSPFRSDLKNMMGKKSVDERLEWSKRQAYIALGNLMTVCALERIDSCPMEGFSPKDYDRILKLEERQLQSVLLLPIGYRASDDFFASLKKVRQPIHKTVIHSITKEE